MGKHRRNDHRDTLEEVEEQVARLRTPKPAPRPEQPVRAEDYDTRETP